MPARTGAHQTRSGDVSYPALGRSSFRSCANHPGIDPAPLTLEMRWFEGMKERSETTTAIVMAGWRREYPKSTKNCPPRTAREIAGPRTTLLGLLLRMGRARGRCRVPAVDTTASSMGRRMSVYHRRGRNPTTTPWRGCREGDSKDQVGCRPRMAGRYESSRRSRSVGSQRMISTGVVVW